MKILLLISSLLIANTAVLAHENTKKFSANDCTQCHVNPSLVIAGNQEKGKASYTEKGCQSCHGENGVSNNKNEYPNLAGQKKGYLVSSLSSYRNCKNAGEQCDPTNHADQRKNAIMETFAATLKDEEIANIAAYLENISFDVYCNKEKTVTDKEKKTLYIRYCSNCHGGRGLSHVESFPNLAFQSKSYLQKALAYYQPHLKQLQRQSHHMEEAYMKAQNVNLDAILDYLSDVKLACQ